MATANWKLTIEFTSDDGEGPPDTTVISQTGDWQSDQGQVPVNESVAITMSYMLKMLMESGHMVGPSTFRESADAFSDES